MNRTVDPMPIPRHNGYHCKYSSRSSVFQFVMNCRNVQRSLHVAPFTDSVDVRAHTAHCDTCGSVAADLVRLECEIRDAAMAVRVPEGLSARVLLRKQLSLPRSVRRMLRHLLPDLWTYLRRKATLSR